MLKRAEEGVDERLERELRQYICRLCKRDFYEMRALNVHNRTEHNEASNTFECPSCHRKFKKDHQLRQHMSHAHPGVAVPTRRP